MNKRRQFLFGAVAGVVLALVIIPLALGLLSLPIPRRPLSQGAGGPVYVQVFLDEKEIGGQMAGKIVDQIYGERRC